MDYGEISFEEKFRAEKFEKIKTNHRQNTHQIILCLLGLSLLFRSHSLHADRSVSHLCAIMSVRVRFASSATLVLPFSAAAGRRAAGGHSPRVGTRLRQPQPQQQYRYRSSSSSGVVTISDQKATQKFTELNQKSVLYFTATWYVSFYIYIYILYKYIVCRFVLSFCFASFRLGSASNC